jgi:hypothetical protein
MLRALWIVSVCVLLSSCALTTRQTDALLAGPREVPDHFQIPNVPFIAQTENYCGPATLTMAMNFEGKPVSVEEIAAQVYTPGKKGTLQQDLLGSARRQGMLAVQVQGMPALTKEVSSGNPVIVFLNLGLSWYPIYHYALVTGYDVHGPSVTLHSGKEKDKNWSMRKFERNWDQSWGLVVLPPDRLAAAATEMEHSAAGAGLENAGHISEAEKVYRNILGRWPESFGALLGMGNILYGRGEFSEAVNFLRQATKFHPLSGAAWHNRAIAEGAARQMSAARKSAARALELAPKETEHSYRADLKEFLPNS